MTDLLPIGRIEINPDLESELLHAASGAGPGHVHNSSDARGIELSVLPDKKFPLGTKKKSKSVQHTPGSRKDAVERQLDLARAELAAARAENEALKAINSSLKLLDSHAAMISGSFAKYITEKPLYMNQPVPEGTDVVARWNDVVNRTWAGDMLAVPEDLYRSFVSLPMYIIGRFENEFILRMSRALEMLEGSYDKKLEEALNNAVTVRHRVGYFLARYAPHSFLQLFSTLPPRGTFEGDRLYNAVHKWVQSREWTMVQVRELFEGLKEYENCVSRAELEKTAAYDALAKAVETAPDESLYKRSKDAVMLTEAIQTLKVSVPQLLAMAREKISLIFLKYLTPAEFAKLRLTHVPHRVDIIMVVKVILMMAATKFAKNGGKLTRERKEVSPCYIK